jgi:hypothetical protein
MVTLKHLPTPTGWHQEAEPCKKANISPQANHHCAFQDTHLLHSPQGSAAYCTYHCRHNIHEAQPWLPEVVTSPADL